MKDEGLDVLIYRIQRLEDDVRSSNSMTESAKKDFTQRIEALKLMLKTDYVNKDQIVILRERIKALWAIIVCITTIVGGWLLKSLLELL